MFKRTTQDTESPNRLHKLGKYLLYFCYIVVGFICYVALRELTASYFAPDLPTQLAELKASLPQKSPDGQVTISDVSFDQKNNVTFTIDFAPDNFVALTPQQQQAELAQRSFNTELCSNSLVQMIMEAKGTISANLQVKELNLYHHTVLDCTSQPQTTLNKNAQ